ncbi:MAG: peptidylprolyl isomerase [Sedimentisphaerales bacterium]|nr:peptidylprolyl isomerase [Sedimentisphaerales bacterium]
MLRNRQKWAALLCVALAASVGSAPATDSSADLKTDLDKISYLIGTQFGASLRLQGIEVNIELFMRGMREALAAQPCALSPQEQNAVMMTFHQQLVAQQQALWVQEEAAAMAKLGAENAWKLKLEKPEMIKFDPNRDYFWILETNKGTIRIRLMPDVAPMHATSTIFLTRRGFYDDTTFHRVITNFIAQGGCPLGTGTHGPGYTYAGEFDANVRHDRPYLVSTANRGPNTDGSQFFITFKPTPWLDGAHTIFGEVVEGFETVDRLETAGTREGTPREELIITKARIEEMPKG